MFTRENFTGSGRRRNGLRSRTIDGTLITTDGERTSASYSSTTSAFSSASSDTARCHGMILTGSYPRESRSVRELSRVVTTLLLMK